MNSIEEDPPSNECIQVTSHNVRETIRGLPRNSSAVTTGSTYLFFMKVTEDRNQITNEGEDLQPHEMYEALVALFNKILRGDFFGSGICSMLLFCKKLVLTPKDDGGFRPLVLVDTVGRILSICANKKGIEYIKDSLQPY
jgi:hypothetical protein